ncbi:MAG TPA: hypothetical protein PLM71_04695 [Syntrophorhabdaceae bacterium]|nr:hypothetical protein [Syntrophorhabdaceae bacterium]HPU29601.1 hypothetical protein [Syntrophorhabdaceae bacterium]
MITKATHSNFIYDNAYIPEHIYTYVQGISDVDVFFFMPYVCYFKEGLLIFIGYPLKDISNLSSLKAILDKAISKTRCDKVRIILPSWPINGLSDYKLISRDEYFRLDLTSFTIKSKIRNMINRASRDITVERTRTISSEHSYLIERFLDEKKIDGDTKWIMEHIVSYVVKSNTAWILNGRDAKGRLIVFDVVDVFSRDYIFYMFNIRSIDKYIPGASDLLFYELIKMGIENKKRYINLGLGINKGVSFFKEKWGGQPFIPYYLLEKEIKTKINVFSIIDKFI